MLRRDEVTIRTKLVSVSDGPNPSVALLHRATRSDGRTRTVSQIVGVPDRCLFERICSEVRPGDEIDATMVTQWSDNGYTTFLASFKTFSNSTRLAASAR